MKLNKHGLKITGLRVLSGFLRRTLPAKYKPVNLNGACVQLCYNRRTGGVWGRYYSRYSKDIERSVNNDPDTIVVTVLYSQHTMQQICDIIERNLKFLAECERRRQSNDLPF